jgi:hypothetical protein
LSLPREDDLVIPLGMLGEDGHNLGVPQERFSFPWACLGLDSDRVLVYLAPDPAFLGLSTLPKPIVS